MNVKTWFSVLCASAGLMLVGCNGGGTQNASAEAAASTSNNHTKTYIVGTNAEFAPFESQGANGQLTGFDIDLMNAMAKAGGFKITFKDQPWDGLFASLNNGDLDMVAAAVTITDERKQSMAFSDPYFEITQVVLVPQDKNLKSAQDLKTMNRIGVATGQTGDLAAQKLLGATSPKIARFDSVPLALKELENGGVDAVVSDSAVIANYVKNNGSKGFHMVTVPDFPAEHYGFAVRKNDAATLKMLNAALQKVRSSGEYEKLHDAYFAKPQQ